MIAGPIIASVAPTAMINPHIVFFSPSGTNWATKVGVKKKRMNHFRLVANQYALRPRNRNELVFERMDRIRDA